MNIWPALLRRQRMQPAVIDTEETFRTTCGMGLESWRQRLASHTKVSSSTTCVQDMGLAGIRIQPFTRVTGKMTFHMARGSPLPNGDIFEGNFCEGRRSDGHGSLKYASGERYVGNFRDEVPDGEGTCEFADGSRYEGEWVKGLMCGQGKLFLVNGAIYSGDFQL